MADTIIYPLLGVSESMQCSDAGIFDCRTQRSQSALTPLRVTVILL